MRPIRRLTQRGFTLVELMIVVVIIGILAALAIYGVRKYVLSAKTSEARNAIGRMAKDAANHYQGEEMAADTLAYGSSTDVSHQLCPSVGATVPAAATDIQERKYQSAPSEWEANGWDCLGFSMTEPHYYQYNYENTGGSEGSFAAIAVGDLDGDAVYSTFQMDGQVRTDTSGNKSVTISPNHRETAPDE